MVQANIDNGVISVQIGGAESVTVPTGETWKVNIAAGIDAEVSINGMVVKSNNGGSDDQTAHDTVVTEGDTIEESGGYDGVHIGGFKI
jgi:hypothetical protein